MSTPDPFLPTFYTVVRKPYIVGAVNGLGNPRDEWGPAEEHAVYGWGPATNKTQITEPKLVFENTQRFIVELELMVPPAWQSRSRDRILLGITLEQYLDDEDNPAYEWYRQVGPLEKYEANPFGWNPGSVSNLVAVEGAS